MQIKSRRGQFSNVCVGTRLRPLSLGTGAIDLATICVADSGNSAKTWCGPVKSSCVNSGKITNPILKRDILISVTNRHSQSTTLHAEALRDKRPWFAL